MRTEPFMEIDGASIRATAILPAGRPPADPVIVVDATDDEGDLIQLRIVGGAGASEPLRQLRAVTEDVMEASEWAESRRERDLVGDILGGRRGEA